MRSIFFYLFLMISLITHSQNPNKFKSISVTIGYVKHGTGDLNGIGFETIYAKQFKEKITWEFGIGATINDGNLPVTYNYNNQTIDGSIRFTTAGIQPSFGINYLLLGNFENGVEIKARALFRYQSSSYYDDVAILYPPATGLPFPVNVFNNTSSQKTYAIGGLTEIAYKYIFENKMIMGVSGGLQIDSNGDLLTRIGLQIGLKL